jgi:hypothetical protein
MKPFKPATPDWYAPHTHPPPPPLKKKENERKDIN